MSELDNLIEKLTKDEGIEFEKTVAKTFNILGFESEWTGNEEASPDVIVKAPLATKPFVAIIECCAVAGRRKVKHGKVNQLREIFPTYQADYGKEWNNVYPVLIGRPAFSKPCRNHAARATKIRLITVKILTQIIQEAMVFQLTNDELEPIFSLNPLESIELSKYDVDRLSKKSKRQIKLYVLIFAALSINPIEGNYEPKPEWISLRELIGTVKAFGLIAYRIKPTYDEISEAARDLSNQFIKAVELGIRGEEYFIRRTSISRTKILENMGRIKSPFLLELIDLGKKLEMGSAA